MHDNIYVTLVTSTPYTTGRRPDRWTDSEVKEHIESGRPVYKITKCWFAIATGRKQTFATVTGSPEPTV
jgi:hypothetical protein